MGSRPQGPEGPRAWDTYWRGTKEAAAFGLGGIHQETLTAFWGDLFTATCPAATHTRVLDLACGHGAVTRHAIESAGVQGTRSPDIVCLDYSLAAVSELRRAVPGVEGVAADAGRAPFADQSFDVVASQFGLEYAGERAFPEALRLLASGGILAALLHVANGAIYQECSRNLAVAKQVLESRLIALASEAFGAGFALRDGRGSEAEFHKASAALVPAVKLLPEVMRQHGEHVASGAVLALYRDLEHMYRRMSAYDAGEVLDWLARAGEEFAAYAGRMAAMLGAAVDEKAFAGLIDQAKARGFSVRDSRTLHGPQRPEPMAWVVVCQAP